MKPIFDLTGFKMEEATKQMRWLRLTVRFKFKGNRVIAIVDKPNREQKRGYILKN